MYNNVVLYVLLLLFHQAPPSDDCIHGDLVFLVDWSQSVSGQEATMVDAMEYIVDEGQSALVGQRLRIGIISFAEVVRVRTPLTSSVSAIAASIETLQGKDANGQATDGHGGLRAADAMFAEQYRQTQRILVLISDGRFTTTGGEVAAAIARKLKSRGIRIVSVYVYADIRGYRMDDSEYMKALSSGTSSFYEATYDDLARIIKQIDMCY